MPLADFLSVIVILFDMRDEAPQTLASLSVPYQRGLTSDDYEVLVIDNGSSDPLPSSEVERWGPNFRYHRITDAQPSPAAALNLGAKIAQGDQLGFIVDGARISSPGLLHWARSAFRAFETPVCTAPAFHLGPAVHSVAVRQGHSKQKERDLLHRARWVEDGYRLFGLSTLALSSPHGWLDCGSESSSLFLRRALFTALKGYDERFDEPGGGLLNHEFFGRLLARPEVQLITLLGEGTFHQMHGGASTGQSDEKLAILYAAWLDQYAAICGKPFEPPSRTPIWLGKLHEEAGLVLQATLERA